MLAYSSMSRFDNLSDVYFVSGTSVYPLGLGNNHGRRDSEGNYKWSFILDNLRVRRYKLTRPFKFQVPTKTLKTLEVEYCDNLFIEVNRGLPS